MTNRRDVVRVSGVDIHAAPYDWAFAREEAARIDDHWTAQCRTKPGIFDGRVLLMRDLAIEGGRLRGLCFETNYRSFLYWRESGAPGAPLANVFGMAALRATDGAFMLGEMNAGTTAAGRLYFPAGTPEPADLDANGRIDFEANILRELEEETGVRSDEIDVEDSWVIVFEGPSVACMRLAQARIDAPALQARLALFNATQDDPELVSLVPVASRAAFDPKRMPAYMLRYLDWALPPASDHADQTR